MNKNNTVAIVGAGLCGSLLAIRLAQRGYQVELFERSGDMRAEVVTGGRSINLALSNRGLQALRLIGIEDIVALESVPMRGRMIHPINGTEGFFPYSGTGEFTFSTSRGGLNVILLEHASKMDNVKIRFHHPCVDIDYTNGIITFHDTITNQYVEVKPDVVFGTDGAGSAVRKAMLKLSNQIRFEYMQTYITHGYKELIIPAKDGGGYRIEKEALHIWPRKEHMVIALPNNDGSFTVTLFQDFNGPEGLDALDADLSKAIRFFEDYYPTALTHMPTFEKDFIENPSSSLGTVKCLPWQINGFSLLMGDAAHAIVPFYGQGMNASFEDVFVLDQLMETGFDSWESLFREFEIQRKVNGDAIADLALDNFIEMRDLTADPVFQRKSILEKKIEKEYPDIYFSKYSMVTFKENISYAEAMERGRYQDKILMDYCKGIDSVDEVDLTQVLHLLQTGGGWKS